MTKLPHHIAEVFEKFTPDWQMRKRYRADTFGDVLEAKNKPFVETYHSFMRGIEDRINLKARIAVNGSSPLNWRINKHGGGLPGGIKDWHGMPMGAFEDNWERHFTRCAFEYWEAKDEGEIACHQITQRIERVERSYHRLVWPVGEQILVASKLLYLRELPPTDEAPDLQTYDA